MFFNDSGLPTIANLPEWAGSVFKSVFLNHYLQFSGKDRISQVFNYYYRVEIKTKILDICKTFVL